jgi:glucose-1-phosphate adenylyltransferase
MSNIAAMILAGGRGKRMGMLCYDRPKPILPFAGRFRVIDFTLSNCIHSQIKNIAVLADYQRTNMMNYLRGWGNYNSSISLHFLEPKDGSYKGTADAVYQNLDFLKKHGSEITLILAGDHIYKMDYRKLIDFHIKTGADATIGVTPIPIEKAHQFGIAQVCDDGRLVKFVEKPNYPESNLVSMGIYVFNTDVLIKRLAADAVEQDSPHDFGYAIMPQMVQMDRLYAYKYGDFWQDIGTIEAYYATNMMLLALKSPFSLNGEWPIFTEEHGLMPPQVFRQGTMKNSIISPGCVVKGYVENSILAPDCWVEEDAVVKNSILMGNNFIGQHSIVDGCILDADSSAEKFCFVGFGSSQVTEGCGVTVVGRGAVIPSHTAVGRNCIIAPRTGCDDFAVNMVPCGSDVSPKPALKAILAGGR